MIFFSLTALQRVSARSHKMLLQLLSPKTLPQWGKTKESPPDSVNRFMTKDNKLKGNEL